MSPYSPSVYKDHNYKAVGCGSNETGSELYDFFCKAHTDGTIFCQYMMSQHVKKIKIYVLRDQFPTYFNRQIVLSPGWTCT